MFERDPLTVMQRWGTFVTEVAPLAVPIVLLMQTAAATDAVGAPRSHPAGRRPATAGPARDTTGSATSQVCRDCGEHFMARDGGGFMFDLLHCDTCGAGRSVSHEELGDIHLGYVKGLPGPYAVARSRMDAEIKATYPGPALTRSEYQAGAEATLDRCACGGAYRYDAPPRCPGCRCTPDRWDEDPDGPMMFID